MSLQPVKQSPAQVILLAGVRTYRRLFAGRPSPCRFDPTCSAYAEEALRTHGALRGSWLVTRRLSRCRPGGGAGFDPVPEPTCGGPGPTGHARPVPFVSSESATQHPRRV